MVWNGPGERGGELVPDLGLDFVFPDSRPDEAEQAPERLAGDAGRLSDEINLVRGLNRPQMVHDRRKPLVPVQGKRVAAPFAEAHVPGFHGCLGPQVLVGVQVTRLT
jgi:hypothetical protein